MFDCKDIEEMLNTAPQHINITGRGIGKTLWTGICTGINSCQTKLLAAPAADVVEVRHGRWERVIPTKSAAKWSTKVSCSQCHRQGYERYNYCPNCGCKMDKEE